MAELERKMVLQVLYLMGRLTEAPKRKRHVQSCTAGQEQSWGSTQDIDAGN